MNTPLNLKFRVARSVLWVLVAMVAGLSAHAEDEYYGGGGSYGGGGGGDVNMLPPYEVNSNDPATFDWAGYWTNWANQMAIEMFTVPVEPPVSPDSSDNNTGGGGSYDAGSTTSEWNRRGATAPTVTPDSKTSVPALNTFLQACKNNTALVAAMKDVKSTTNYTTQIWEQGLAILIKPNGTVTFQKIDGNGPNNSIAGKDVTNAFVTLGAGAGDVKVFYHDHANQGPISDADISSAVSQNTIAIARDESMIQMAVPTGENSVVLVKGDTNKFGL